MSFLFGFRRPWRLHPFGLECSGLAEPPLRKWFCPKTILRRKSAAAPVGRFWCSFHSSLFTIHFSLNSRPARRRKEAAPVGRLGWASPFSKLPSLVFRLPSPPAAGKAPLCKGCCQPNGDPNATQRNGCVWERRSEVARKQSRYTVRDCGRYAVRDDEGDCNLHGLSRLRDGQRTPDYNPSAPSGHLPLHRGGFSLRRNEGRLSADGGLFRRRIPLRAKLFKKFEKTC